MPDNRRIVVNLENPSQERQPTTPQRSSPVLNETRAPKKKRGGCGKILLILGGLLLVVLFLGAIGGYWWWSNLQKSPAYSLALLINAARKDDQKTIDQFLDTNAVVDNFVPQVETKAKERYARGLPPDTVKRAEQLIKQYLTPVLPTIKEQARRSIPRQIKERAQAVPQAPSWALAAAIGRAVTISESGDTATVKGNLNNRPLEITMQRNGERWKIVAATDESLADKIAQQVAQMAQQELTKKPGRTPPPPNRQSLEDLRKQLEQLTQ